MNVETGNEAAKDLGIYFQDWSDFFAAVKYVDRSWEYTV